MIKCVNCDRIYEAGEKFCLECGTPKELKTAEKPGLAGFSFGVGAKFGAFKISYALSGFNQAGAANYFGLALFFNEMKKEKVLN